MVRWKMKHAATADEARCNGTCTALDFLMEKYCILLIYPVHY